MKKLIKISITFLLLFNSFNPSYTQSLCGTPSNFPNTLPTYNYPQYELYDITPVCIRVFFHIVRRASGTNGYNPADVPSLVNNLNQRFNPHNIFIVNEGLDFIDDDDFGLEFNDCEFNDLVNTNSIANAVNIYLLPVNVSGGSCSPAYGGRASSIPGRSLVVGLGNINNTSTLAHEVGHCLNLFHTHHQLEDGGCQDNGANCNLCGDFVCDTPVDPQLQCLANVNNIPDCDFTGGGGFTPDTRNVMSYSCAFCRDRFSVGQGLRMRISISNDPMLSTFITNQCMSITGANPLCSSETYTLANIPLGATGFSWTINNTNFATIQPPNNNATVVVNKVANGQIELRCVVTIPTGTLFATRDIGVGNSTFVTGYIPSTPRQMNWNDVCPAYLVTVIPAFSGNPIIGTFIWESVGTSPGVFWGQNGNNLTFYFSEENQYAYFKGTVSNTCGSYSVMYRFRGVWQLNCPGYPLRVALNPNPSKAKVRVSLMTNDLKNSDNFIHQVKLIDTKGVLRKVFNIGAKQKEFEMDIYGIESGTYIIHVFNGKIWIPGKLVIH